MANGSMGVWDPLEEKYRPGLYNRFITTAINRVKMGSHGIVGIPVKADWGPIGAMVELTSERQIESTFGTGGTTYLLKRLMTAGKRFKPGKVITYRMASKDAAKATVTISETVTFTAKHAGIRGNAISVSVTENLIDDKKMDVKIYEGAVLLSTYTVEPKDINGLAAMVNADAKSLLDASAVGGDKPGELKEAANTALAGGTSGATLTADAYLKMLEAFEAIPINVFVLDGVTDSDILLSVRNWVKRVRQTGLDVIFVQGGTHEQDSDPSVGNLRSIDANHEAIVNVTVGTVYGTTRFSSAETAVQIAGLIAGCPINKSVTYKELESVDDVTVALSNEQIIAALRSGSFVLVKDVDAETGASSVKAERGLNTLTVFPEGRNNLFSKIRVVRTLDAIDYDTGHWAAKNVIGELNNNPDGRATLISGIKLYLETLVGQNAISADFLVELDSAFVSEGDTVYLATKTLPIDSIEKIFNTINVG